MGASTRFRRFAFGLLGLMAAPAWAAAEEQACEQRRFEGAAYLVCAFDPAAEKIAAYHLDGAGAPLANFDALRAMLSARGEELVFAMNGGMFDEDLHPIGLYIENGALKKPLNRRGGWGNFHLKPNGVFWIKGGAAGVTETEAFAAAEIAPDFATQSGPMLVIKGELHPKFRADSDSLKWRNGVGVTPEGRAVFALSLGRVNFHAFARFFRDALGCPDALYLDGTLSSLYSPALGRNDRIAPLGPLIGVSRAKE